MRNGTPKINISWLVGLVGVLIALPVQAQTTTPASTTAAPSHPSTQSSNSKPAATPVRYQPDHFAGRAGTYYQLIWGVDQLRVKIVESGELVRFTYRVVDANKAAVFNDKNVPPSLIDPRAGVSLVVPSLEKVGSLRQSNTPEAGKSYWMAFSNKGGYVKRGDRVDVVIGHFRAQGLVVE